MNYAEQSDKLAGPIALLKKWVRFPAFCSFTCQLPWCRFISRSGRETAEDATQMFGGRGITMGGMGKIIENVRRLVLPLPSPDFLIYSSTEPHLSMLSSLVQRMSWETLVFGRRFARYQRMRVFERLYKRLLIILCT